jgi:hypothetical protein
MRPILPRANSPHLPEWEPAQAARLPIEQKRTARMPDDNREEDRPTEDDIARAKLGPRGVPGVPSPSKMTPQREKKTPKSGDFDGHTA